MPSCPPSLILRGLVRGGGFALLSFSSLAASHAQPAATALPPITVEPATARRPKIASAKPTAKPVRTVRVVRQRAVPATGRVPTPSATAGAVSATPGTEASAPLTPDSLSTRLAGQTRGEANSLQLGRPEQGGSRLGLTPLQTPASVDVISAETIQERGEHDVIDAVSQNATGITAIPSPGNGGIAYTSRGFSGDGSVLQLLDGTRLYVGAGTVTFPFDTWSAERIDVLRGPASVLYGEGAIGGAIDIISKKPIFTQFQGEIEGALGDYATRRIALDVGGPLNDPHWATRFTYSGNSSAGYVNDGNFSNNTLFTAISFQPSADFTATIAESYGDRRPSRYFGEPLVNGELTPGLRFINYDVSDATLHYADNYTQFKTQWLAAPGVTLDNQAYYLEDHRHFRDVENYAFDPVAQLIDRSSYIEIYHTEYQVGDRLAATFKGTMFGFRNQALVGGDVNNIYFERTDNTPFSGTSTEAVAGSNPGVFLNVVPLGTHSEFQTRTNQGSVFAEDHLDVTDKLALLAGGRFESDHIGRNDLVALTSIDKTFRYATYRVGAVFMPLPGLAFYGQYATGVDGLGNLISLSVTNAQFSLSPGRQVEVGVKDEFAGGRGQVTLAAYDIVKSDLLTTNPSTLVTQQVGEQSSRGLELNLSYRLSDALRFNANLAVLRAKYDNFVGTNDAGQVQSFTGAVPMNVPQQVGNAFFAYDFAPRWELRAGVQYVGRIYGDNGDAVPLHPWAVVNAQLEYRVQKNLTVTGRVYNLLDNIYATSAYSSTQAILGTPRSFEVAANYRF